MYTKTRTLSMMRSGPSKPSDSLPSYTPNSNESSYSEIYKLETEAKKDALNSYKWDPILVQKFIQAKGAVAIQAWNRGTQSL